MSTGKRLAATALVWIAYCYALTFGAHEFERPDLWFWTVLSVSMVATVLIWVTRRRASRKRKGGWIEFIVEDSGGTETDDE